MAAAASAYGHDMRRSLAARCTALLAALPGVFLPAGSADAVDRPTCQGRLANLWGTDADDTNDTLQGHRALVGPTVVWLGAGGDTYVGLGGAEIVCGEAGADSIKGNAGNDVIEGGDGDDTLIGDEGDDQLRGQGGDDVSDGGPSDDTYDGGDGYDSIVHEVWPYLGPITLDGTAQTIDGVGHDTYADTERIVGTAGADEMRGGPADEVFDGGASNQGGPTSGGDRIDGGGGDDVLSAYRGEVSGGYGDDHLLVYGGSGTGGDGKDLIEGFGGDAEIHGNGDADVLVIGPEPVSAYGDDGPDRFYLYDVKASGSIDGGAGVDLFSLGHLPTAATVDLTDGIADWDDPYGDHLLVQSIEWVRGTRFNDRIEGSLAPERLDGAAGPDVLLGRGGDDVLIGGDGPDVGDGGNGTDVCDTETRRHCEA